MIIERGILKLFNYANLTILEFRKAILKNSCSFAFINKLRAQSGSFNLQIVLKSFSWNNDS